MNIRDNFKWLLSNRVSTSRRKSTKRCAFRRLVVEQMEDRRLLAVLDLATLSATQGTTIFGAAVEYRIGSSVSDAGDVNGDGFEDFIIGAPLPDSSANGKNNSGESYLIFGSAALPATIDLANLATLGPTVGITIYGADAVDFSGISVSSAGDVNGDGFDDLIIGAHFADALGNLKSGAGESSVIFGKADWSTTPTINLASLGQVGQPAGITIFGADIGDRSGVAVSSAGDVNGDGFDDLVIGANSADSTGNARPNAGDSYVIFGAASLPTTIDLNNLGSAGITIFGADADDEAGLSVSTAGDVNGDGFDDILIGAQRASGSGNLKNFAGENYLIFGGASLPVTIDLATMSSLIGITIFGADIGDQSGNSVSTAGDINGDGFDDLLVAALFADASGNLKAQAGDNYVIFGAASLPQTIDLSSLGSAGITIFGADASDRAGNSVSSAGDVNGDGFDDLIIGSRYAAAAFNNKALAGESYVIFGAASLPTTINLNTLGSAGITIFGASADDQAGASVSSAGDVNGDGFDDLIIGAPFADASGNLKSDAGESYLIFGGNGFTGSVTHLGTTASETLTGTSAANRMVGGRGNDTLIGDGGADVLIGGQGNDLLRASDLFFSRIDGGTGSDTFALNLSGLTLDLTTKRDSRILGIETIDITGIGNNTLVLNQLDVLNISDSSNALNVRGNAGDRVYFEAGWIQGANQTIGPDTFQVFTKGRATLRVSVGVTVRVNSVNLARLGVAGTTIFGADIGDGSGYSVSDAGDVNGDGFDDLLIGANSANASGNTKLNAGDTYVIFGAASLPATIDLANLGSAGITIFGADPGDNSGRSVSSAGDFNGDGFGDIVIGARDADAAGNAKSNAGESYVIFGKADWSTTPTIDLASLGQVGQPAGITIFGVDGADRSGTSVSKGGDVNGDGFDDLIIGAFSANASGNAKTSAGESYVIFGGPSFPATIDLANLVILGPTVGITIFGADALDQSGLSVSSVGDVNGDGFDDLLIGARYGDALANAKLYAGESYVVFGAASLPGMIDLATLGQPGQPDGIAIFGTDANDQSGFSVSDAGDINGDGFDDLIIGARFAGASGNAKALAGESYVIFGASSLPSTIDLNTLGSAGITLFGASAGDQTGDSVSSAGDVNGDGFDDLLIGARDADAFANAKFSAGESYVIFGKADWSANATIDLANLTVLGPTVGITLYGADRSDVSGESVSSAGDVNGDGFGDFIIGAPQSDGIGNLEENAGESYLIFGGNGFTSSVTNLGTTASETLTGNASANTFVGGRGNDVLIGAGGADVLIGGLGDDTLAVSDLNFRKVVGGNGHDTLRLDGSGLTLNLTNFANNRILGIETIDITGTGNNTLQLTRRDFHKLSDQTNVLFVRGNTGDTLAIDQGWTPSVNQVIGVDTYQIFLNGPAILRVLVGVAVREAFVDLQSPTGPKVTIVGAASNDNAGTSVNNVGDVNDDGFDDFVIGAPKALGLEPADTNAGVSYLIFGGSSQLTTIDLLNLGTAGVSIFGADLNDFSGTSVDGGDINGDGFGDIVIGAPGADTSTNTALGDGKTYVIFGRASFPATLDLSSSNGASFTILGLNTSDNSGFSVSVAGDLNGDGYEDILIGARFADSVANGRVNAGESYIVFGAASFPTVLSLSGLGTGGVTLFGRDTLDIAGTAVSGAGDVNGDGFDDLLIGAYNADALNNAKINAGEVYLIYGRASFPTTMDLFDPAQINVTFFGADIGDRAGVSLSSAGDVNGDGFDDFLIGADRADGPVDTANSAGETYLVFGGLSLPSTIDLGTLGSAGMMILSSESDDRVGSSVSRAGDINADGFDDILIGARFADGIDNGRSRVGESYVVFGKASLPSTLNLGTLGTSGLTVFGIDVSDASGASVNAAGDVNGDGFDDFLVGSYLADGPSNARINAGEAYLIFGGNRFSQSVTQLGTANSETLTGSTSANVIVGGRGNDTLIGAGGADILIGGQGDDILTVNDLNFRRVIGGNGQDTLRLVGSGLSLNLNTIRDNRIQDIETIDIKGAGNNTLTLTALEVLNLSSHSNTLIVRRDSDDIVNRGAGWTQVANETIGGFTFEIFTQGRATLKVQLPSLPPVVSFSNTPVTYMENAAPFAIFNGVTITDVDTPILTGGDLTITNTNGELTDRLTIASSAFVTISGNSILVAGQVVGTFTGGTGTSPLVVTFTSQASLNRVVAILSLIRFSNVSDAPTGVSRIVSVRLTDGAGGTSTTVNRTVGVTPVNDAPVLTLPTTPVAYVENAAPLAIFTSANVTDADTPILTGGVLTITNTNGDLNDRLSIVSSAFVIVSGNSILVGGQVVGTFTGGIGTTPLVIAFTNQASLNRVVAILSLIRFSNVSDAPSGVSRIISVRVTDGSGGTSTTVNRTVGVTPVNDAPVLTLPTTPVAYVENAAPLAIFTSANVTDADTPILTGGVLTITNTNGDLNDRLSIVSSAFVIVSGNSILVGGQVVGTFTGGIGTTPLVVTFTSQASLNRVVAILSLIRFSNVSNAPSGVSRIISARVTDGSGGTSAIVNRTVGVTPVNDAPVISAIGPAVTFTRNGPRVLVFSSTSTITDLDNTVLTGGRLTIANTNGQATDSLAVVPNASITVSGANVSYNGSVIGTFTGGVGTTPLVFTFNNQATPARIRLVLLSVGFLNSSTTPSTTPRTISVQITDGFGGTSALQSKLVNVV